jgi:tRNA 5-methylaminomethyl-2-thiouridine biosynthesis bifunctional protein
MKSAVIIGGGIAGCSAAYALAEQGFAVTLVERHAALATEASGNPLAVLNPRLTGQNTALEMLNLHGYLHTLALIGHLGERCEYHACGVIQLAHDAKSQTRLPATMQAYADQALFHYMDAEQLSELAGVQLQHAGLYFQAAGGIHLPTLCKVLVDHPRITIRHSNAVLQLDRQSNEDDSGSQWQVMAESNFRWDADVVVIANANDARLLQQSAYMPLMAVRGQLSYLQKTPASQQLKTILCSEGYITPAFDTLHYLGASFNQQDDDASLRTADHESNLQLLETISSQLFNALKDNIVSGRVAWRSQTSDYLPVAGQLLDVEALTKKKFFYNDPPANLPWLPGLYISAGHGAKGLLSAPLCGHIIARHAAGAKADLPLVLLNALQPNRFILRKLGLKHLAQHLINA